jgi:hypothetical protein
MATLGAFTNALFELNGTDLSDHVESLTVNRSSEMLDVTAMGDTARSRVGGLVDWSIEINFHQDYAAGEVDATVYSLIGTTVCFEIRPQNICSTVINPRFSQVGVIETYNPVGGAVGTVLDTAFTIQCNGADIDRDTAAT